MRERLKLALLLVGMFNFATALMVVDEIIGASVSGERFYPWPSGSFGANYYFKLGIMQSWEACFSWITLSVGLMLYAVSRSTPTAHLESPSSPLLGGRIPIEKSNDIQTIHCAANNTSELGEGKRAVPSGERN